MSESQENLLVSITDIHIDAIMHLSRGAAGFPWGIRQILTHAAGFQAGPTFPTIPTFPYFFVVLLLFPTFL